MIGLHRTAVNRSRDKPSYLTNVLPCVRMKRVQIQFTDAQIRALRVRADGSSRPVAAIVRDAVDAWFAADDRRLQRDRALASIGGFHSGLGDLAERHDEFVDEADG